VEAENCPATVFDQLCLSFHPARMPPCPTARGLSVRFATLDQNFFRGCQYTQSSYLQGDAVHNGGRRETCGKALPSLFRRPAFSPESAVPVDPAQKRSFANAGRIQPSRHRSWQEMPCLQEVASSIIRTASGILRDSSVSARLPDGVPMNTIAARRQRFAGGPRLVRKEVERASWQAVRL
jgi:hypothetical protein